ncbi:MAG: hypothetical protein CM15mP106_6510 [Candidatus Neomarinimicrobiota bacterium]|nr:MAG: hypothetical protein CM15mP106_6510 [Candidatus Neomarinimicrobiota bacterium]
MLRIRSGLISPDRIEGAGKYRTSTRCSKTYLSLAKEFQQIYHFRWLWIQS